MRSVSPSSVGIVTETYVFLDIGRNPSLGENRTGIRGLDKTLITSKPVRTIEDEPWGDRLEGHWSPWVARFIPSSPSMF